MRSVCTLICTLILLSSCASYFVRKDCEKTDWFEYGRSVAMSGNHLSGNTNVRRCEDASSNINYTALDQGFKKGMADYCQPEIALATGRRGEFFSPDMCDGSNIRFLKAQHQLGVIGFCQKSNGESVGASGKAYNQICPKDLEENFLIEYRKGRKKYLAATVLQTQGEIDDTEDEIGKLENQKQSLITQLAGLGPGQSYHREIKYDPYTQSYHEENVVKDNANAKSRRESLQAQMSTIDSQIAAKRAEQSDMRKRVRQLNSELLTL